jgi:hypothetical protein
MVIPHWNPWELLVAGHKIQISAVCCNSLTVVVKSQDLPVRQRNASHTVAPAIVSVLVLVDVVSEVNDIVYRVLSVS